MPDGPKKAEAGSAPILTLDQLLIPTFKYIYRIILEPRDGYSLVTGKTKSQTEELRIDSITTFDSGLSKKVFREAQVLVIAHEDFIPTLEVYKKFKDGTGRPTTLVSWQEIASDKRFKEGRDIQEKIKLAIKYYHKNFGTEYVTLVGDADRFPVRYIPFLMKPGKNPTYRGFSDLYYSDLYKKNGRFDNWDADHDGLIGEYGKNNPINHDRIDYHPDVYVGRVPASNIEEVKRYVEKVVTYESTPSYDKDWFKRGLLILAGYEEEDGKYRDVGMLDLFDNVDDFLRNENRGTIRLYDERIEGLNTEGLAPGSEMWGNTPPKTDPLLAVGSVVNGYLNQGAGVVLFGGHGDRHVWEDTYRDEYITRQGDENLVQLNNNNRLPVVLGDACGTAKFAPTSDEPYLDVKGNYHSGGNQTDRNVIMPNAIQPENRFNSDSFAEAMTVVSTAGAIAYLGATTYGNGQTQVAAKYYIEGLYSKEHVTLGQAWKYMVEKYMTYYDVEHIKAKWDTENREWWWRPGEDFFHAQKFVLFGDPSVVYGGIPADKLHIDNAWVEGLLTELKGVPNEKQLSEKPPIEETIIEDMLAGSRSIPLI